jgi:polyisoprenoid-binding protein YceI
MKHRLLQFFIACLAIFSFDSVYAAAETYTLDSSHSYVEWRISHLGFSYPSGKWMANGTLILDKEHPQDSKVNVIIHVTDLITGNPELDKHLKGKLFFDTDQFPDAIFVSSKVQVTGKDTAKVYGMLTLHGVTKPVVLNVKLNKMGSNPITDKMAVGFSATTQLQRSDFGVSGFLPAVGDKVNLTIEVEAYKP